MHAIQQENEFTVYCGSPSGTCIYALFDFNSGHKAYVGFLYLEHTYNNAVVNMFVKLMMNVVWARQRVNIHYGNGDTCKFFFVCLFSGNFFSE